MSNSGKEINDITCCLKLDKKQVKGKEIMEKLVKEYEEA